MQQGDADWLAIKAGKISGSRFAAVMALHKRTGKPNKPRLDLIADLRRELETGVLTSIEPNEAMAHGTRCEPMACALYAWERDVEVQRRAWVPHPEVSYVGFSPDGEVGGDGLVEIKCPFLEPNHLRTVESGNCPDKYIPQVQGGLWVTGRQWCDFVSFWEPTQEICVVRVQRDEQFIARLQAECAAVWVEVITAQENAA